MHEVTLRFKKEEDRKRTPQPIRGWSREARHDPDLMNHALNIIVGSFMRGGECSSPRKRYAH